MPIDSADVPLPPQPRTSADLQELLQIGASTARRYRQQGLLPSVRVGGLVRFGPVDFLHVVEAGLVLPRPR